MARKQKKRPAARRPVSRPAADVAAPRTPAATGGGQALVRSVEMSLGATARTGRRPVRGMAIDGVDPGIPLDRVPYFTSDLARLGITAVIMVILVVGGTQLIPVLLR